MTLSELQQQFSDDPEEILGPNYETVFNFWAFLDMLSYDQLIFIGERYEILETYNNGFERLLVNYTDEVIADEETLWQMVFIKTKKMNISVRTAIAWATHELICMHKLIENSKQISIIPIFDYAWERLK